jgi:release factor glutamine methyltransferase
MHTIEATWRSGAALLKETVSDRYIHVSQTLLAHVLQKERAYLYAYPEKSIPDVVQHAYRALLARFLQGELLQYLCGNTEFYSLDFIVNEHVLIPRPETELLVEQAIASMQSTVSLDPAILDLGTGSGAIAISLALHFPKARVTAIDISEEALRVASENARRHACQARIQFICSHWFNALSTLSFDCIVSNPPYLRLDEWQQSSALHREPQGAFIGGVDGLDAFREIAMCAKNHLKPEGVLLFEHGFAQAAQVRDILQEASYCEVFSVRDFAEHERVTVGRFLKL